ncbi:SGNH hydrolase domain-containing protein [Fluviispira multicolorata]|uniref:SGNH domain-containing protein n=1 Tax=Fluviispira multicolorata TaxID=2654512 RepID=A0A833N5J9_9BACT|nr:SGNH hydrolase domain-containing protein [Fluviispira multicolorata]KAB8028031.1 hypothetical protein GCL57_13335 [Fluviispira multicolorata]
MSLWGGSLLGLINNSFGSSNVIVRNKGGIGYSEFGKYFNENFHLCFSNDFFEKQGEILYSDNAKTKCYRSKKIENNKTEIVIIGDSHGQHLFSGISQQLKNLNVMYIDSWPLPDVAHGKILNSYFNWIIEQSNHQIVIISAYWLHRSQHSPNTWQKINNIVKILSQAGKTIYISNDIPTFSFDPKNCKYSGWLYSGKCDENFHSILNMKQSIFEEIEKIKKHNKNTYVLNTTKFFCNSINCSMSINGNLFYRDKHHLNLEGSIYIGKKIIGEISKNKINDSVKLNENMDKKVKKTTFKSERVVR